MTKTTSSMMPGTKLVPEIVTRRIDELVEWDKNPRLPITDEDLKRLESQISKLGVYKPLLINQQNIILGGNRRILVYRRMGFTEVVCSLVRTDNEAQMMEYALSDNDQVGATDEKAIAEFVKIHPIDSELYAISSSPMKLVSSALKELEKPTKPKTDNYTVRISFANKRALESALPEIKEVLENYPNDIKDITIKKENHE